MDVLIIGGTPAHRGGVEAFCARAAAALGQGPGWHVALLPSESAYLGLRSLPRYLTGLAALLRARFRRRRPDIVWLQYVNLPDLGYLVLARLLGLPVLVTPHLGAHWRSQSVPTLRRLSRGLLGLAQRIALLADTQLEEVDFPPGVPRSKILTFLPEALLEAPLQHKTVATAAARPLALLHSARLSEGKGSFLFVEVCRQLAALGVAFEARITGSADAATAARLEAEIAQTGLGERLRWDGRANLEQQIQRLDEADVLVHLSLVDSYPLIVLEALAFGVYPVCVDLAGARDMVGQYLGATVPQDEAVTRTVAILAGLDLASLRAGAPALAARVRSDYDWRRCVDRLAPVISATAARSSRG